MANWITEQKLENGASLHISDKDYFMFKVNGKAATMPKELVEPLAKALPQIVKFFGSKEVLAGTVEKERRENCELTQRVQCITLTRQAMIKAGVEPGHAMKLSKMKSEWVQHVDYSA